MKTRLALLLLTVLAAPAAALEQLTDIAPLQERPMLSFDGGWQTDNARPDLYAVGTTKTSGMRGEEALVIAQRAPAIRPTRRTGRPTASMHRTVSAEEFHGKRVRLSARLKTQEAGRVSFSLNASGPGVRLAYGMSDMEGTKDWQTYEIVMDVPADAACLSYGLLLGGRDTWFVPANGNGIVWADSFKLEAVGPEVDVSRNYLAAGHRTPDRLYTNWPDWSQSDHTSARSREAVTAYDHRTNAQMNANNGSR